MIKSTQYISAVKDLTRIQALFVCEIYNQFVNKSQSKSQKTVTLTLNPKL
jgi:hypothetical protein